MIHTIEQVDWFADDEPVPWRQKLPPGEVS